jgi:hypothetical protein
MTSLYCLLVYTSVCVQLSVYPLNSLGDLWAHLALSLCVYVSPHIVARQRSVASLLSLCVSMCIPES